MTIEQKQGFEIDKPRHIIKPINVIFTHDTEVSIEKKRDNQMIDLLDLIEKVWNIVKIADNKIAINAKQTNKTINDFQSRMKLLEEKLNREV